MWLKPSGQSLGGDLRESRTGGGVANGLEHGNSAVIEERL